MSEPSPIPETSDASGPEPAGSPTSEPGSAPAPSGPLPEPLARRGRVKDFLLSGGYSLVIAGILAGGVAVWRISQWGPLRGAPPTELDLTTCLVPRETLRRGAPAGSIPRMDVVRTIDPEVADRTKIRRGKFLVKSDLVIGVALGAEAVAYPLRFLAWHEVVNDTVGGVSLAVCYGPLDGGVGVFERSPVRPDGQAQAPEWFQPSGVLSQSAQLVMEKAAEGPEAPPVSLWSPLLGKAVTGPAAKAGLRLKRLPCEVLRWEDWRARHPKTKVMAHDETRVKLYGRAPYSHYAGQDELRYPVDPLPPPGLHYKALVLAVRVGESWKVYPIDALVSAAQAGRKTLEQAGRTLSFEAWLNDEKPPAASITGADEVVRSYWFAWYASRAEARELAAPLP